MSKDLNMSLLLDFYGEVLSEPQREAMDLFYNGDLSLSEIAEIAGITRQGVRDRLVKSEQIIRGLEEKLGLVAKFEQARHHIASIRALGEQTELSPALLCEIEALAKLFE